MEKINIAFGATPNWFQYTRVSIASILYNADSWGEYHFYIMASSFSKTDKEEFEKLKKIHECQFHYLVMNDDEFNSLVHDYRAGIASLYRLKLPELVQEDKILYLDSDLIVNENILELYLTDVKNYYLAAVEDKLSKEMSSRCKLNEEQTFFNGGVILMNMAAFRNDDLQKILFDKIRENEIYTDQDALNDVCRNRWLSLPIKYNYMPIKSLFSYWGRKIEAKIAFEQPFVVHYTDKPWEDKEVLLSELWFKYKEVADKC